MPRKLQPNCDCDCDEFITEPSGYGIYQYMDGEFHYQRTEIVDEAFKLYCRECGEEAIRPKKRKKKKD